jgi:hypothetical protein
MRRGTLWAFKSYEEEPDMKWFASIAVVALALSAAVAEDKPEAPKPDKDGFYPLFDGKTLDGWKAAEVPATFKVEDGLIVVNGNRAHLFYDGPVNNHDFKNFHLKAEVKTMPNSNSGIYFHTKYQEKGWPDKGFECQVNNTYAKDPKKTGGLYSVKDVMNTAPVGDNEWFTYDIIVDGSKVTLKINGKTTTEWEQPEGYKGPQGSPGRVLDHGTIALQGHDPGSKVFYRSVAIKPLP